MNTSHIEKFVNAIACDLEEGGFRQVSGTTLRRTLATAVSAALPLLEARNRVSELAGQQAIAEFLKERDEALGCPDATDAERAESARLIAALAATGKQQVGEVSEGTFRAIASRQTASAESNATAEALISHALAKVGEVQGDARITTSEDDFTRMVEGEAGEHGEMLEDGGPFSGWCFSCEELLEFSRGIINAWGMERRAQEAALAARQPGAQVPVAVVVPGAPTSCKNCGGTDLEWFAHARALNDVQQGRLNTHDVGCVFVLGCEECSETLHVVKADDIVALLNAAPPAQAVDERQPVAQAPGWSGWATQKPGHMPKLWGTREIAELNHDLTGDARLIFLSEQTAHGIDLGQVREIRIPARNNLDPISVFVQDQAAGRGRIVVTCYGNAWQAFWGAMGDHTVMEFVAQCDADYVAGNMISGRQTRMTKAERAYTERIAREVIAEFQALIVQRDAAPGVE